MLMLSRFHVRQQRIDRACSSTHQTATVLTPNLFVRHYGPYIRPFTARCPDASCPFLITGIIVTVVYCTLAQISSMTRSYITTVLRISDTAPDIRRREVVGDMASNSTSKVSGFAFTGAIFVVGGEGYAFGMRRW